MGSTSPLNKSKTSSGMHWKLYEIYGSTMRTLDAGTLKSYWNPSSFRYPPPLASSSAYTSSCSTPYSRASYRCNSGTSSNSSGTSTAASESGPKGSPSNLVHSKKAFLLQMGSASSTSTYQEPTTRRSIVQF